MDAEPVRGLANLPFDELCARAVKLADRRADDLVHRLVGFVTQEEWARLAAELGDTPVGQILARRWAAYFSAPRCATEAYRRRQIGEFASFYELAEKSAERDFLVLFAGVGGAVGLPTALVLAHLEPGRFDVLRLTDPARLSFRLGVPGVASDLRGLAVAMDRMRREGGYRRLVLLGASKGGLPALRVARMAGAAHAVMLGPRWHDDALLALRGTAPPPAFDLLCACFARRAPRGLAIYGAHHAVDHVAALRAETLAGVRRLPLARVQDHNVALHLWQSGRLRTVLGEALNHPLRAQRFAPCRALPRLVLAEIRNALTVLVGGLAHRRS